jgi:hypothetical protein
MLYREIIAVCSQIHTKHKYTVWAECLVFDAFPELHKATISFVMSVRLSAWNNSSPTGRIVMVFYILVFFENLSRKYHVQVSLKSDNNNVTSHKDQYTILITSRSVILRMRHIANKRCRENHSTHFIFNNLFSGNRTVNEKMWKNIVEPDRPQMAVWRMRIACWITTTTNTFSKFVIIIAFPGKKKGYANEPQRCVIHTYIASFVSF